MEKVPFGTMPDGKPVELYTLRAGKLACEVMTYGGTLRAFRVPDREGRTVDVLLGFDTLEDYRRQDKYLGALVGRYANRIGGACFQLEGKTYRLAANDGVNHLHGGTIGFSSQVWTARETAENTLSLSLQSPDGQEGYPGAMEVRVTYTLDEEGLTIRYQAAADRTTVCNLTNHAYFNLAGHDAGAVTEQFIQIFAGRYTPTDSGSIPTGELAAVEGTPMDLRRPVRIGEHIEEPFPQLRLAGGFDHNWVLDGERGVPHPAARAYCKETGILLETETTLPGVQFYTGNYLDGCPLGKGGVRYGKRGGFCLETQLFPDTPNHPAFPSCVLRPGEAWDETTIYRFGVQ